MGGKRGVISPMEFFSRSASNQNLFSPSFHHSPTSSSCHASQRLGLPGSSTAESPPSYSPFVNDSSLVVRFKCAAVGARLLCMIGSPELEIYVDGEVIAIKDVVPPALRREFSDVYIVNELMDTDLHQIIRSNQGLSEEHCQYFLYQILRGLKYIHSANVIHRDLKPSNLLLNANCDLKIIDFGLARLSSENELMTEYVVTRWYRAPELLLNSSDYTAAIDVWSVGCIFMELMNRKPLFAGKDQVHQMRLVTELLGTPSESDLGFVKSEDARRYINQLPRHPRQQLANVFPHVHPLAIDLIDKMLTFDPAKRITVEEALAHPYLARLHDIADEPVCLEPFSFDFEQDMGEEQIKDIIYQEAISLNPEYA